MGYAMGSYEKTLKRLQSRPKDFSWSELQKTMTHAGFQELLGDGSRRKFYNPTTRRFASFHKRHPDDTLLSYQVKAALDFLKQEGVI